MVRLIANEYRSINRKLTEYKIAVKSSDRLQQKSPARLLICIDRKKLLSENLMTSTDDRTASGDDRIESAEDRISNIHGRTDNLYRHSEKFTDNQRIFTNSRITIRTT